MSELQDRLGKAKFFTKLDLKDGFYLIRMAQGEELKTAFRFRQELDKYRVMSFGLCLASLPLFSEFLKFSGFLPFFTPRTLSEIASSDRLPSNV
jgi:hypothetical protein